MGTYTGAPQEEPLADLTSYKPKGRNFGGVGGKKDGFESWAVSGSSIPRFSLVYF